MKKQYLELAQQACNAERRKDWELACNLWFQSIDVAYGMNRPWASARYEFCCYRNGVRPSSFIPRYS
ncbi:ANR family transcriptional regulator [Vibrio parahaemolyticus]|uniref:ANR family transcriptional regulator n=1 Tax=Vibrio parahaemolyticus TaxID=670 RepID=UPI003891279A